MNFALSAEQQALAETVQRLLAQRYGFEARRKIIRTAEGWSREVWAAFAEMGLLALQIPEAQGGMAPAPVETLVALTAMGRALVVEPYLSSAILGTALVRELGSPQQRDELLPSLAAGTLLAVPAHGEPDSRHELARVATTAARRGGGWVLRGKKAVVLHAPAADRLLVTARSAGGPAEEAGLSVFAVPAGAAGLSLTPYTTFDGWKAAEVELAEVFLPAEALLGPEGGAYPALATAFDLGLAAVCAEAIGALQATLDTTIEYVKTRKQFGVPIGKFQALQHRLADMLLHVEQGRSMGTLAMLKAAEPNSGTRARFLSAAKVTVGQACRFVGQQAVQLHGGMGVSEEVAVSHLFRRLTAIELWLGDSEHHLERFLKSPEQQP